MAITELYCWRVIRLKTSLVIGLALLTLQSFPLTGTPTYAQSRRRPARSNPQPRTNYAEFSHVTHVTKQKLACDSCHKFPTANWKEVRKGDAAFPDVAEFPDHASCLNCHRQQFFARERPAPRICSNCHVAVTPRDTARFLFPSLGDVADGSKRQRDFTSEFNLHFPHETHLEVVSRNAPRVGPRFTTVSWTSLQQQKQPPANCGVCHQTYQPQGKSDEEYVTKPPKDLGDAFWLKKGTFKTSPNSHTGCFTCHNADSGIAPVSSDCQACHKLADLAVKINSDFDPQMPANMKISDPVVVSTWQERMSAGTFRHEGGAHPDMACADCHAPARMNTVDVQTLRVPVRSCGGADGCHVTKTLDDGGILNYEIDQKNKNANFVCTKCHITFGRQSVPASHLSAIPK
ncbi:MAG TPA: cytochrome c3 family protein [Pyrinomonadaceae bacterium]|nr:cytochrome c3 family protein [Pyrinomonadaceae bacterium]